MTRTTSKWELAKEKIVAFTNNRYVRGTSRLAKEVLETISLVDRKNKFSYLAAGASLVHAATDSFDIPPPDAIRQYTISHGYTAYHTYLARMILATGIEGTENIEEIFIDVDGDIVLKRMRFPYGDMLYQTFTDADSDSEQAAAHRVYYVKDDFDLDALFAAVWEKYKQGIFLTITNTHDPDRRDSDDVTAYLRICELGDEKIKFIGENPSVEQFSQELRKYREKKVSRSYMLIGEPGTGKSSFAIASCERITNRIIKMDPDITSRLGVDEVDFILQNLRPDAIILDDFDTGVNAQKMLFVLEVLKKKFPEVFIFATVNDFKSLGKALVRPGRIDKKIWFDLPDAELRGKIAKHYLEEYGVAKVSKKNMEEIVDGTKGLAPAYIRDLCMRIGTEGDWSVLPDVISEYQRSITESEGRDYEDEDGGPF